MKTETKLALNSIKKNSKRSIFTIISILLCTVLIFTTMILISSIKNGIYENMEEQYKDYHFVIKNLSTEQFNKIKDQKYIDKIYIQQKDNSPLREVDTSFIPQNNTTVYLKYINIKKVCTYTTDIIRILDSSNYDLASDKYEFNTELLTTYGLIDVMINSITHKCEVRMNYSYIINIMIILLLVAFSILFIIILYNAFLISINEKKKEYAILNSIGATEGQILKTIFIETIIMGLLGIIIGGLISFAVSNEILKVLNNMVADTGYNFKLIVDYRYIILSLLIIVINIYISALIPSIKASTTSVIQQIRNNKQIKRKKRITILERTFPIEGKIAIKNINRNGNKYRFITILMVVCMTSYIAINTYIKYEKETSKIVTEYDVDAEIGFNSDLNFDYKSILKDYETKYKDKVDYIEYKQMHPCILIEPANAIMNDIWGEGVVDRIHEDNAIEINMLLIGLDDETYSKYVKSLKAKSGDIIIYNQVRDINTVEIDGEYTFAYKYLQALRKDINFKLNLILPIYNYEKGIREYEIVNSKSLNGNFVLTDELVEGFSEIPINIGCPIIFMNMETYNKISLDIEKDENNKNIQTNLSPGWELKDLTSVKIKCEKIIELANYIDNIDDTEKNKVDMYASYYSLYNQEKIIYINVIELILKVILLSIIIIGIVSTINAINASLCEREEEFKILNSVGATKRNINKILVYESIYTFIKATIISIILSIPILYKIIETTKTTLQSNKLLIPFENIGIFSVIVFLIILIITLSSTTTIEKNK